MGCCHHFPPNWAAQKIIPKLYWKAESQEQRIMLICQGLRLLAEYVDKNADQLVIDRAEIEALQREFEEFKESGFDDYYLAQVEQWVKDNLESILHILVRQVYFGLNEQGYFVAYVPESWNDIVFDTGADYTLDTYGRLILRFDVDSPETVNQTPEVVRPDYSAGLASDVSNMMNTLYATE